MLGGHCLCGAVRWSCPRDVTRKLVCHCTDCQRATSSGFTAFVGVPPEHLCWLGTPTHYQSSPGGWRGFCPDCGTRLYFRSTRWPGEIHMHAATLDDPASYRPDKHVKCDETPSWIKLSDDLPRSFGFDASPADASPKE